ncbi:MAG: T9SS type A sorting domain-containing protein, partial [Candidatus Krumholzibacteria bacterium]|nr:T9SS type A sorting domain-containing protein [Candidatus Krumholzibacteria bacterium]
FARAGPMEFTILPAGGWRRGGNTLYIDDADDRGGEVPIQLFFDWDFTGGGIADKIDRYDVLSPSSLAGNSLASRVKNVTTQVIGQYKNIIWSSASLSTGLIGDGTSTDKSDDFSLLLMHLDQHPDNPGLFITGDNNAEEWVTLAGAGAVGLKSMYMNFNLLSGDHVAMGEQVSPALNAVSPIFTHGGVPHDEFIAYGGCPIINRFDVLQPTGTAQADLVSSQSGNAYVISQATANSAGSTARVLLTGFSLHEAHSARNVFPAARPEILYDVLVFFQNPLPTPSGIDPQALVVADYLDHNYPNPFNPSTTIRYGIRRPAHVSLRIYNAAGQLVKTLVDGMQIPRAEGFAVEWDGHSDSGVSVASGVYFYRLVTSDFVQTKKMVLLK